MLTQRTLTAAIRWIAFTSLLSTMAFAADAPAVKLVIVTATYGDLSGEKAVDVTQKVAALVADNSLSVAATKEHFGEPSAGAGRKLKVGYTVDGIYRSKTVDEGETLDISTRLLIRKAVYGDLANGKFADVTEDVADQVRKNRLSVKADNQFGDPANGVVKKLRVDYSYDGVPSSKTVTENQTLTLPDKGN